MKRYYVCEEAPKKEIEKGKFMFPKNTLGKATEMKDEKYECGREPKTVYFSLKYADGAYVKAKRYLFTCPTTDEEGQKYYFGQGFRNNEIGIYKKITKSDDIVYYCFIGVMKDIDLVYFKNSFLRWWNKIPLLNLLAPY